MTHIDLQHRAQMRLETLRECHESETVAMESSTADSLASQRSAQGKHLSSGLRRWWAPVGLGRLPRWPGCAVGTWQLSRQARFPDCSRELGLLFAAWTLAAISVSLLLRCSSVLMPRRDALRLGAAASKGLMRSCGAAAAAPASSCRPGAGGGTAAAPS